MKTKKHIHLLATAALLLALAACTQDETAIPTGETHATLPYGEYPLQIGGVTLDAESSAEPWSAEEPQTRVAENDNGTGSVWQWDGSEMIGVRLGNETATYTLNVGPILTADKQLYWTSTAPATVTAWYPTNETVDLSDQSEGLAYMLKAEVSNATYNNEITLDFKHQLAKVRVVLNGTQASLAQSVEVYGYTTCTNNEGAPVAGDTQDWIKMKKQTYGNTECWEANVVPGNITITDFIRINGQTATVNDGFPTTLEAAKMYTIDLTVGKEITEITADNCQNINGDGYYRVSGGFGNTITVTGGNPIIYLENANISVGSGNAIGVTGNASPTIHVVGEGNTVSSDNGAGIYVAQGSSVTITGRSREEDELTATGRKGGAGIGSYSTSDGTNYSCGNIIISNVTLTARSEGFVGAGDFAAGIGSAGVGTVGSISISDATIYAQGGGDNYNMGAAAIGGGVDGSSSNIQTAFDITISNSTIHATRSCSQASYIGAGGLSVVKPAGYNIISTARITDSHVYDESGNEITQ